MTAIWVSIDTHQQAALILVATFTAVMFLATLTLGLCRTAGREMPPMPCDCDHCADLRRDDETLAVAGLDDEQELAEWCAERHYIEDDPPGGVA